MRNVFIFTAVIALSTTVFAQTSADLSYKEIDKIEEVLETNFPILESNPDGEPPAPPIPVQTRQKADFSDVDTGTLYSDLVVFQKNYMPKSGRLQLTTGIVTVPTDVFYLTGGLALKAAYHFSEAWGLEAFTNLLSSSARQEVNNISNNQLVSVNNLVSLRSFSGLNLYYNFIYGKLSLADKKVLPFEIFNTVGMGTMINTGNYQSTSMQIGLGGLFSLSRSTALRFDLTWAFYETQNILGTKANENSTFLSLGYSWFFPEPDYR